MSSCTVQKPLFLCYCIVSAHTRAMGGLLAVVAPNRAVERRQVTPQALPPSDTRHASDKRFVLEMNNAQNQASTWHVLPCTDIDCSSGCWAFNSDGTYPSGLLRAPHAHDST
jgi:hypothetical protein